MQCSLVDRISLGCILSLIIFCVWGFSRTTLSTQHSWFQDYGIDFDGDKHPVKSFECLCGSRYCRGRKHSSMFFLWLLPSFPLMIVGSFSAAFCEFSSQVSFECVLQGREAKLLRSEVLTESSGAWLVWESERTNQF